jgi:hypothetical protein
MESESSKSLGKCPACSAAIPDGKFKGGTGGYMGTVCNACGAELRSFPTNEELKRRQVVWGVVEPPYPGEQFVATIGNDNHPLLLQRIERLVDELKRAGFRARCPRDHTCAGVLVPSEQATAARDYLSKIYVEYLRVWVSDEDDRPITYIGNPAFDNPGPAKQPGST